MKRESIGGGEAQRSSLEATSVREVRLISDGGGSSNIVNTGSVAENEDIRQHSGSSGQYVTKDGVKLHVNSDEDLKQRREPSEDRKRVSTSDCAEGLELILSLPLLNGDIILNDFKMLNQESKSNTKGGLASSSRRELLWLTLRKDLAMAHYIYFRIVRQIASMIKPTAGIVILVGLYVVLIGMREDQEEKLLYRKILIYKEQADDNFETRLRGSLVNASLIVAGIIMITFIFLLLFSFKLKRTAEIMLLVLLGSFLCAPFGYFLYKIFVIHDPFPLDIITYFLVIVNFTIGGLVSMSMRTLRRTIFNRAYLVCLCLSLVWPFAEFPEWTVWCTLGLITLYDLLAVLAPCGPLRFIMERELSTASSLPGLMYPGEFFRIGLGDFVFYGVLIARSMFVDSNTTIACSIAVVVGLIVTIIITRSIRSLRAIPALPVSVVLGFVFYAATPLVINPSLGNIAEVLYT